MTGAPSSWLDDTRPPVGVTRTQWAALSWHARHVVTVRTMPPAPSPADPPWRLVALTNRARLDQVAPHGRGHVKHRRPHRRTSSTGGATRTASAVPGAA